MNNTLVSVKYNFIEISAAVQYKLKIYKTKDVGPTIHFSITITFLNQSVMFVHCAYSVFHPT